MRDLEAHETLQRLAAAPKLTVVREALPEDRGRGRKPLVLCVLNRYILSELWKSADLSQPAPPLIQQLEGVNVEPVPYNNAEIPALIAEIAAAQRRNTSPDLINDFSELLAVLAKENDPHSQVVFY